MMAITRITLRMNKDIKTFLIRFANKIAVRRLEEPIVCSCAHNGRLLKNPRVSGFLRQFAYPPLRYAGGTHSALEEE